MPSGASVDTSADRPLHVIMEGVSRQFGATHALQDVSLEMPAGTILGVIGPSGSGKTTLIRMLTGTLEPTSGLVRVLGENPRKFRRQTRESIGYLPQLFVLYPDLTVAENVAFVASLFGLLWGTRRRRVREVLEFVGLWDVRDRRAQALSGGMQRRLALACSMVHEPSLLFVDEPTAGLDPVLRQTIWEEFRRLRDEGRTLVVTTQYVGEAEYCDEVAVLVEGRLLALDQPEQLRKRAIGGEVIEVKAERAFDGAQLRQIPGVEDVRQSGPRRVLIVTEDAGATMPRLVERLNDMGVAVESTSEYRPSFDEVFTDLVARSQDGHVPANGAATDAIPLHRAA